MLRSAQHDTSPRLALTSGAPLFVLAIVCALASAAIWLGPGIVNTRAGGDSPFLLIRTYELAANLRAGIFPARWMPDAAYGLGYPFFNFYASLPYYLAAALTVLGVDLLVAIKLTQTAGMFAAGFAMLLWARTMLHPQAHPQPLKGSEGGAPWAATLAACAYVLAPFHLVNIYVRGDSLSEFWAFVWFPLILWGVQRVTQDERHTTNSSRLTSCILLALWLAALVLTHNVSALIFAPFIMIYALALLLRNATTSQDFVSSCLRGAIWLGVAALLALALSAWFWLPALAEAPTVQLGDQTTGYFNYANHFRAANLVQLSPAFDYAVNENGDAFAMGLLQTALAVIGAAAWWMSNRRAKRSYFDLVLMLGLFALATFMITPLSEFIWARAPLLPLAQFPWRFLSVQAVFAAVLIGGIGGVGRMNPPRRDILQLLVPNLCIVLLLLAALIQLPNERLNIVAGDVTPHTIQLYEWYTGNIGTTIRGEYLPRTALPRPYVGPDLLGVQRQARISKDGVASDIALSMSSQLVSSTPTYQEWRITTTHDAIQTTLPLLYSPAWRETINGISSDSISFLTPNAGSGWAQVYLQKAGKNSVVLKYVGTSEQELGNLISLIALFAVVILLAVSFMRRRVQVSPLIRPAILVIACLSVLLFIVFLVAYIFQPRSEDLPTLQTLDYAKRPFPHRDPVIFRAADGASYELIGANARTSAGEPLRAGDALTLSLQWRDDRAPAAITVTQELPMGGEFASLFRYAREQSGGDPRLSAHVVPSNTLPGPLLLKLQASDAAGNLLTPFNPDGSALTTHIGGKPTPAVTLLGPSVIETPPNAAPPHLHTFDNGIALHEMDWLFASEQTVCFRPVWAWGRDDVNRADALQVSLRLRGSDGREIATADSQPQAGLAPTWSWPAGVLINDSQCVPVKNLLNLGEPYTLQIVWYRLASLEQVAEVTLRGAMSATLREDKNYPEL